MGRVNDLWSQLLPKSAKEGITDSLREGPGQPSASVGLGRRMRGPRTAHGLRLLCSVVMENYGARGNL